MTGLAAMRAPGAEVTPADAAVLDMAKLSAARRKAQLSRRPLSRAVRALLWTLRIYVVLMLAVVVVQLARLG